MVTPGRTFSTGNQYRYGFDGKENDRNISNGAQDYGMRISDVRIGKFLSVDPLQAKYASLTPFQFASNSPISGVDLDGKEFVLTIYDPATASNFMTALTDFKDIYWARQIAFEAIHSKMTQSESDNLVNAPTYKGYGAPVFGIVPDFQEQKTMMNISKSKATLEFDKNAAKGLTVKMNKGFALADGSYSFISHDEKHFDKGETKGYEDASYPVDVRTINS